MADECEDDDKRATKRQKFPEDDVVPPTFGPEALGLYRVGTKLPPKPAPSEPVQKLNARGMPARIKKKNRYYDDFIDTSPPTSARQSPKRTPTIVGKKKNRYCDDFIDTSPPTSARQSPKRTPTIVGKKKNRYCDDFIDTLPPTSARQSPKRTPTIVAKKTPHKKSKSQVKAKKRKLSTKMPENNKRVEDKSGNQSLDCKSWQHIGIRLRHLLKLPKAHKWVCFEYFYSNIDKVLFDGENDFMICLKRSFPQFTNKKLTKVQWVKIRRIIGKPRRCSQVFFAEERKELERKRKLIRLIQQRKTGGICVKDLPNEIPLQLVVGSKVTARVRKPQDGLFTGCIDAVDTSNNTYRITFERRNLGTHSIPDFEVLSNDPPDTISLLGVVKKFRPKRKVIDKKSSEGDPTVGCSELSKHLDSNVDSFPLPLLESIVRLTKIIQAKRTNIDRLKEYNYEAEKSTMYGKIMSEDFKRQYATVVMDLERMNMDLKENMNETLLHCQKIDPGSSLTAMLVPSQLQQKCFDEAALLVEKNSKQSVLDPNIKRFITDLTALMIQVKGLSDPDQKAYKLSVLKGTMEQIRMRLEPRHQRLFQSTVEVHMHKIMGLFDHI